MASTQTPARGRKQAQAGDNERKSSMEMARDIFKRVNAEGYKPSEKSVRQEFLKLAQSEAHLTPSGASTYWQNLSNEQKGEPLYKYSGRKTDDNAPRRRPGRPARNQSQPQTQAAPAPVAKIGDVEVIATPELLAAAHQLVAAERALANAVSAARQ